MAEMHARVWVAQVAVSAIANMDAKWMAGMGAESVIEALLSISLYVTDDVGSVRILSRVYLLPATD